MTTYAINLYPNPTTSIVTVSFEVGDFIQLEIVDISGKVLQAQKIKATDSSKIIFLENYATRGYVVRLSGNRKTENRKAWGIPFKPYKFPKGKALNFTFENKS